MRIVYFTYFFVWTIVLLLYSLGWSEFCIPLDPKLLGFLLFSVIVSILLFLLSKSNKNIYEMPPKKYKIVVFIILLLYIINFIYAGYIPFVGILLKKANYVEFPGIPMLYAMLVPFSLFYFFYLMYYFFMFRKVKYLKYAGLIFIFFLLIFSRNCLIVSAFGTLVIWLLVLKHKKKIHFTPKNIVFLFLGSIILMYLFGCLGNVRSGYGWNDSSYIEKLGLFTKYPNWLPKQFMWGYIYIVSPLANLNYNVVNNCTNHDVMRFIFTFVPEFIIKRVSPEQIVYSLQDTMLIRTYFNAQTTYVESFYCLGILGCYITFGVFVFITNFFNYVMKKKKTTSIVSIACLTIFVALSFFYNVFFYMLSSMLVIYSFVYFLIISKRRYKTYD